MGEFFIDKHGIESNIIEDNDDDMCAWSEEDSDTEDRKNSWERNLFDEFIDTWENNERKLKNKMNKESDFGLEDSYITTNYSKNKKKELFFSNVDEILKKSSLKPGLEKLHSLPQRKSQGALKLERQNKENQASLNSSKKPIKVKAEYWLKENMMLREKTKGKKWFDIPATEITNEIKTDMEVLKMRSVLDSKHVYKKNNFTKVPKYFQVGTVVEGPADFYNGRIVKSQRKKTIVDELLADAECKSFQKKKFKEIVNMKSKRKHSKNSGSKSKKIVKKRKVKK